MAIATPRTGGPVIDVAPGENDAATIGIALERLKKSHGGTLHLTPGVYRFGGGSKNAAELTLDSLTDVNITGRGATLLFNDNAPGIRIKACNRVRLFGVTLRYTVPTSAFGTLIGDGAAQLLRLDPSEQLSSVDGIYQVSQFDSEQRRWPRGGVRSIFPPSKGSSPTRISAMDYSLPASGELQPGQRVAVKFTFYGGSAIQIMDDPVGKSSNDIVIDTVHIRSTPGIAIAVEAMGRGLAIINSDLRADTAGGRAYSSNYDAIHIVSASGDILIRDNDLSNMGDDAVNLRSPIHHVVTSNGSSAVLDNHAAWIKSGDHVAFFDDQGTFLQALIVQSVAARSAGQSNVDFGPRSVPLGARFARTLELTPRRYAIAHNRIGQSEGHAILAQVPDGLIADNMVQHIPRAPVRLITSFAPWAEGAGAIDVVVRNNVFDDTGIEPGRWFPWGAISVYAQLGNNTLAPGSHNGPILLHNNRSTGSSLPCLGAANAVSVKQDNDHC